MAQIDYLPIATADGANVQSQAAWVGSADQTTGVVKGIASSQDANKAWRQCSMGVVALAYWISETLNVNMIDDGNVGLFVSNIISAIIATIATNTITQATAPAGDSTTKVANTAFVTEAIATAIAPLNAAAAKRQCGRSAAAPTGDSIATVYVPFPVAFSAVPVVVCSPDNVPNGNVSGRWGLECIPTSITVNGFTAYFSSVDPLGSGGGNILNVVHCNWIAELP